MAAQNKKTSAEQRLVSLAEAAEQFGVSVKTIRRRIADGTVHGYRVGRLIRVDLNELQQQLLVEIPSLK
ncbi:helix-turn-helix domain-containing protein [Nesterenkonia massiliensis]|uniref:Helix-turn-helix domain-containing protein n=1 Tax=Nesterenkonia massiliensis TaxID=1232429 RepID=A0ABT2HS34_9MICC|nr:helix-turn-helix domain-containing protein [Nesterenkonia massiliensis]MCT1607481.1 helix-turn-helix domain-containing protein [Nesterenkonia massiliensis]